MTQEVRSYVSKFAKGMTESGSLLKSVSEKILDLDQNNINLSNLQAYSAGLTYVANISIGCKKTQKEIADSIGCSVKDLRNEYKGIVQRHGKEIRSMLE